MMNNNVSIRTKALYTGNAVEGMQLHPESMPLFMTNAFTMKGFEEALKVFD